MGKFRGIQFGGFKSQISDRVFFAAKCRLSSIWKNSVRQLKWHLNNIREIRPVIRFKALLTKIKELALKERLKPRVLSKKEFLEIIDSDFRPF